MKKITLILGALLMLPLCVSAQAPTPSVYFKFDASVPATNPDPATTDLVYTYSEEATPKEAAITPNGANVVDSRITTDAVRGGVFELANQRNFLEIASLPINGVDWSMSFWYKWNGAGNGMILKFLETGTAYNGAGLFFQRNQGWTTSQDPDGFYPGTFTQADPGSPLYITNLNSGRIFVKPFFVADEWHHFVFTFDTFDNKITAYKDGAFYAQTNEITDGNLIDKNYEFFRFGNSGGQSSGGFYDDFKVYSNKVLTGAEALADYNSTVILGVEENNVLNSQIKLYTIDNAFRLDASDGINISKVNVFNMLGQDTNIAKSSNNIYNTSTLAAGLYIVKISDDEGKVATKRYLKK